MEKNHDITKPCYGEHSFASPLVIKGSIVLVYEMAIFNGTLESTD